LPDSNCLGTRLRDRSDSGEADADWFSVFCHELAHVRRRDGWSRILLEFSTILFLWQPLIWMLRHEHERACEEACDNWVLFAGADPCKYAATLTLWIRRQQDVLALGFSSRRVTIRRRIERLVMVAATPQPRVGFFWLTGGSIATVFLITVIPLFQPWGATDGYGQDTTSLTAPDSTKKRSVAEADQSAVAATLGDARLKHGRRARVFGFDPTGKKLISVSESINLIGDRNIRFWDAGTGELTYAQAHRNCGIGLTPDRQKLLVGKPDGTLQVIDVATYKVIRELPGLSQPRAMFAISNDGTRVASCGVRTDSGKQVNVWDLATGNLIAEFKVPRVRGPGSFALSANGKLLATAGGDSFTVWDVDSKKALHNAVGSRREGPTTTLAFTPDGQSLITVGLRGNARMLATADYKMQREFRVPSSVRAITLSPSGDTFVAVSYRDITLWNISEGTQIWNKPVPRFTISGRDAAAAFSPDGQLLAYGAHNHVVILDANTGQEVHPMNDPVEEYTGIAIHPLGTQLEVGTTNGDIKI
jgi:WD40 repeat protein